MPYEKVHCSSFSNDILDDDDENKYEAYVTAQDTRQKWKFSSVNNVKDSSLNYVLHSSYAQQPHLHHFHHQSGSAANPLNKLFCSLISGLPNEIDFGLRITTIIANSKEADWIADFKFIDILLESCKLYSCSCSDSDYNEQRKNCNKNCFSGNQLSFKQCSCYERFWFELCNDEEVFELVFESVKPEFTSNHTKENHQRIYDNIQKVAEIVRSLTFSIEDKYQQQQQTRNHAEDATARIPAYICTTLTTLKFIVLMFSCPDPTFHAISLDILSNIAPLTALLNEHEQYLLIQQFIYRRCVSSVMSSNDVHCLTRYLEIVTKLLTTGNDEVTKYITSNMLDEEVR